MNKYLKISLITIGSLILLALIVGIIGWFYLKSTFLYFEGDYIEKKEFNKITIDGYSFLDRNGNEALDLYEDDRKSTAERVDDALSQMTIEEKIHLLKGSGIGSAMDRGDTEIPGAVGTIVPTPRLGLPTVYLSDGPAGLRIEPKREGEDKTYYCTAFPIGTLLASTWNTDLVEAIGKVIGNEAMEYGLDVILAPGVNIHRHPFCGRNFEYYSEDPLLTGHIGAAMVNGIESTGVGTSVKHFVANNQETNRIFNDAIISDRAMREIYLKGFEIIVKESQPWTIMSSYNKVNGAYVAESKDLLSGILRDEWGFEGLVMSDWFGGKDPAQMIRAGNDLLEPGTKKQWDALTDAYEEGILAIEDIDKSVKRILRLIFESKKMQNYQYSNNPDLKAHAEMARQSATEGMVLLKNEQTLPLQKAMNVALLGVTSFDFIAGGTGSGDVNEAYTISLEEGLENSNFEINQASKDAYETHRTSNLEQFIKPKGLNAMFEPYNPPPIPYTSEILSHIVLTADVAIITIGRNSGEGGDRKEVDDFLLTQEEQKLIDQTCRIFHKAGKKVVVVMNIGGVIETASWKDKPDAILLAWQGGQEGGNSVAEILSGKVNPSGKLPMTFPIHSSDHASNKNFPQDGIPMKITDMLFSSEPDEEDKVRNTDFTIYEEDIYVGYRHFDKTGLDVSFPFGYGLSYTDFDYTNLNVTIENDTVNVTMTIQNMGEMAGKEVAQVYISKPNSTVDRPLQELKAFSKTKNLQPDESEVIALQFSVTELRYWDENVSTWQLEKGNYFISAGSSSRDIRAKKEIEL